MVLYLRVHKLLLYFSFPTRLPASFSANTDTGYSYTIESAGSLTYIFNKTLISGVIPADWQTILVTPIYEKGSKFDCTEYMNASFVTAPIHI